MNQRREPEILCPLCDYRPRAEDRWSCMPSCGCVFHTFWTGGVCPSCAWKWEQTQCPACDRLSPHKAWYRWPEKETQREESDVKVPASA